MDETGNFRIDGEKEGGANDGLSLFDVSAPDDFLLLSTSEAGFLDEMTKISMEGDNSVQPSEFIEPGMSRKNDKYNLRKSLAWDSAFFTSAGVLEPEELSSIIEGADNSGSKKRQMLPGVQEDLSKSTESRSTFENDSLTLESLEADLFCDIRASIQRSSKASTLESSIRSKGFEKTESTGGLGAKITNPLHGNIVKSKSASKKTTTGAQGQGRLIKPLGGSRESSRSILRPPAKTGKVSSTVATTSVSQPKRTSIGACRVRSESNNNSGSAKVAARVGKVSRDTRPGDSRSIMSKTKSSSKSSSSSSTATVTGLSSTRSSCDSTSSYSSVNHRTSSQFPVQRKTDGTVKLPSSSSKHKTQSKSGLKGKVQPGTSRLSAYLKSTSKQSSSVSPASSISEWSSVSSSSTFTGNQKGNSSRDYSSSHKNVSQDLLTLPIEQTSNEHESEVGNIQCQSAQKSTAGSGPSSNPISGKPSGLRLPSPKIGFFDGVKAGGRTPIGGMQTRSGLPSSRLPKSGAGDSSRGGVTTKGKTGNHIIKTNTKVAGNFKSDSPKSSLSGISKSVKLQNDSALTQTLSPKVKGEKIESKALRSYGCTAGKNNRLVDLKSNQKVHCDTTLTENMSPGKEVAGGINGKQNPGHEVMTEKQNVGTKEYTQALDKRLEVFQKMVIAEEIHGNLELESGKLKGKGH